MNNQEVESRVHEIMQAAGTKGLRIDMGKIARIQAELELQQAVLYREIVEISNRPVRVTSNDDVAHLLFDELKLKETPRRSVAKDALARYDHPIVDLINRWNTANHNFYSIKKMLEFVTDGRVQSTWETQNETSGRMYVHDANIQATSVQTRKAFIAEEGKTIVVFDYKQFELRVLAVLSQSESLKNALNTSDPHKVVAAMMLGKTVEEVTPADRKMGKVFNFGLVFGMTPGGLASRIGCTGYEARKLQSQYFKNIAGVAAFIQKVQAVAFSTKKVTNPFGHTREITDWSDPEKANRQAICTMVQGTAASFLKRVVIKLAELQGVEILATVHDSVVLQAPAHDADVINSIYQAAVVEWRGVKFEIDLATGPSWGDAQEQLG